MSLDFDTYQNQSQSTAIYPGWGTGSLGALSYVALGLTGEAGEVANKVKKLIRDGDSDQARQAIIEEIGDVIWYLAQLSSELDTNLSVLAQANLDKLADRKARDVLGGSGDNR